MKQEKFREDKKSCYFSVLLTNWLDFMNGLILGKSHFHVNFGTKNSQLEIVKHLFLRLSEYK